ncbi:MAG: PBSX family phage terminase large subunit [Fibromonadales bacterium]|nr:PBSX family phage terminase large subunit [Fibromonadales bacterium]
MQKVIEWNIPAKFKILDPNFYPKARHRVLYGGRGGGKSWAAAATALSLAMDCSMLVLCTREIQLSLDDSMHRLFVNLIKAQDIERYFSITQNRIMYKPRGSEFIFKGMHDIKSLASVDLAIVEEAQQVSRENAERLIPTIRRESSELWWLFNPNQEDDWVYDYFLVKPPPPETLIEKVNYYDNPYCPQVLKGDAEHLKATDYEEYKHIWLGELKPAGKGWGFINPLWIEHAASGNIKPLEGRAASRWAIGCDPAFQGNDKCVYVEGKGNRINNVESDDYSDSVVIAKKLNYKVMRYGRFNCDLGVDAVGIGKGVKDIILNVYKLSDCFSGLDNKDKDWVPVAPRGTEAGSIKDYDCWRSQAWCLFAYDLEMGNIDLSGMSPEDLTELKKQIKFISKTRDKKDKIRITSKDILRKAEYLGYSPDLADAVVAWNWVRKRDDSDIPRQKVIAGRDFGESRKESTDGLAWLM